MSGYYYSDYSTRASRSEPDTGRHPVNVGHLVMGLAFLGLAAVWGADQLDLVPDDNVRWLLPLPWVFAGAAGLMAVALSSGARRRRRRAESAAPASRPDEPIITPDHTSDLDEKLARYDTPEDTP